MMNPNDILITRFIIIIGIKYTIEKFSVIEKPWIVAGNIMLYKYISVVEDIIYAGNTQSANLEIMLFIFSHIFFISICTKKSKRNAHCNGMNIP